MTKINLKTHPEPEQSSVQGAVNRVPQSGTLVHGKTTSQKSKLIQKAKSKDQNDPNQSLQDATGQAISKS